MNIFFIYLFYFNRFYSFIALQIGVTTNDIENDTHIDYRIFY